MLAPRYVKLEKLGALNIMRTYSMLRKNMRRRLLLHLGEIFESIKERVASSSTSSCLYKQFTFKLFLKTFEVENAA